MGIKFGTDGWRAVISKDFTFDNLLKVAQGHATSLKAVGGKKVVIGYDTRFMSEEYSSTVAEVFSSNGFKVVLSDGFTTTPAVSLATRDWGADEGVVITASHNTYQYHGYKIKGSYGGAGTEEIIKRVEKAIGKEPPKTGKKEWEKADLNSYYLNTIKKYLDMPLINSLQGKVVHDPMFGATQGLLKKLLDKTEVLEINNYRDAFFGFKHPEPIDKNLTELKTAVVKEKALMGIANDGDGDRVGIVDEKGEFLSTQVVFALLLLHTVRVKGFKGAVAKTVSTTSLVDKIAEKEGLKVYTTPVGFKHIAKVFLNEQVAFGGEESGGYAFGFHIPERDGLLAGAMLLEMVAYHKKPLSEIVKELFSEFGSAYYKRLDLKVEGDQGRQLVERLKEKSPKQIAGKSVKSVNTLDGVRLDFDNGGWVLFRASGTEPVLRIYVEMPKVEEVDLILQESKKMVGHPQKHNKN
ncbi:MAG: phosphoglucomutase/phosphomannomutase family protein [Aquificae bacterium]|nr:phosphoglucomutase/phosphomannomutase family protein [Aquificota bacterium]